MSSFRILEAANAEQYAKWLRVWLSLDSREVFAHPEYAKLFVRECDLAICAVMEAQASLILLPMILRPLSAEVWVKENIQYFDVATPYGFGGPYTMGDFDMADFWSQLSRWALETGVISAFFRLSPFASEIKGFVDQVDVIGGNVIRSLTEGKDAIFQDYDKDFRRQIRVAQRNELRVEIDDSGEHVRDFLSLYYATMDRNKALGSYYISEDFIVKIVNNLSGQFIFVHVLHQGKIISSSLVLLSQDHIYAFLLGTSYEYLKFYPNSILHHETISWGIDHHKKAYVLGGGYEGHDGIFIFKKRIAPGGVVSFYVGKHIFNNPVYQEICEARKRYEIDNDRGWDDLTTFFPAYRSKGDLWGLQ
jgi:hypothetical protein